MNIAYAEVINVNREAFLIKLIEVCDFLQMHPSDLMIVIRMESKFNRKAVNKTSKAVGLIQWIPRYVKPFLGYSSSVPDYIVVKRIQSMSGVQQLELIKRFLAPYKGKMTDRYQAYLAVFYPKALGKPDDYLIGDEKGIGIFKKNYEWNKNVDRSFGNKDGKLTISDIKKFVDHHTPKQSKSTEVPIEPKKTVKPHVSSRKSCPYCLRAY